MDKIAEVFDLKVGEAMEAMIAYFKLTKQNPVKQSQMMNELKSLKEEIQEGVIAKSREMVNDFLKKQKEEHQKALNEVIQGIEERESIFLNEKALDLWNSFKKELSKTANFATPQMLDKYQKFFEILGKKVEKPMINFNSKT